MGRFVSIQCAIRVMPTQHGLAYLLFEKGFENLLGHRPQWQCVGAGYREDVLRRVFSLASECEAGFRQDQHGRLRPEGYLRYWQEADKQAKLYGMDDAEVRFSKVSAPSAIEKGSWRIDENSHCPLDRNAIALWDNGDQVSMRVRSDFHKLEWLIRTKDLMPCVPFRYTDSGEPHVANMFAKCVDPAPDLKVLPLFRLFDGEPDLYELQPDNVLRKVGWISSYVERFVKASGQTEIYYPGWAIGRFPLVRAYAVRAPALGTDCVLMPVVKPEAGRYEREAIKKILSAYPQGVRVSEIIDPTKRYRVTSCREYVLTAGSYPAFTPPLV